MSGHFHAPAALPQGRELLVAILIGDRVGFTAGMVAVEYKKSSGPAGNQELA
jgi:hypothetical protein